MSAPDGIRNLVESFENHIDELKSKDYNEMTLCANFINPFFEFLGWDVTNKLDKAEKFKDVVQQYRLTIGGTSKAPDYLFRIGGSPVFFVEAKKPAVDIEKAKEPAFQLRRYGWNKKDIDVSILTDFETLSVYDCRIKPSVDDEPHVGRVAKYTYKNFLSHWEEIESFFSRTNIEKGSLDKLLKEKNLKGVRESVDESFLKMIEDWRDILARNIALRNENLDVRQLNFAVQQTIDRIIFLRIAEDRGLETPNQLQALTNAGNIYGGLVKLYENADSRYNSGLFHFRSEKGIDTPPDTISMSLSMDDKVLKDMIVNLYPPKSPYDFSAMPADILGQVYERFLGKVIRLTDGHHAKVEEKHEVRKAGGVYYTPTYIVNYIVQNTVGKLVEGKSPEQVSKLRILDPACGSGSFLIGAYQYLLDWHLDWYLSNDREKWLKGKNPPICEQMREGQRIFRLTTEKRKEILKNNIFGVDIDRQAVEVSKLNLLLKVLEEENNPDLFKHSQRALPDLGSNIKCGNSLIGSDFYNGKENLFNNPEETWRINAFDWDREFPEIVKYKSNSFASLDKGGARRAEGSGKELEDGFGFDAVIGNPPWGADLLFYDYIKKTYTSKTPDSSAYFIEKAVTVSKLHIGFILPKTITYYSEWNSIRQFMICNSVIQRTLDTGLAFKDVNLESAVIILNKEYSGNIKIDIADPIKINTSPKNILHVGEYNNDVQQICNIIPLIPTTNKETELILKLNEMTYKIGQITKKVSRGLYIPTNQKSAIRNGETKYIDKVPFVKRYYLENVANIELKDEWLDKVKSIMVPRVFLKVLRGNRLVCYPDIKGEYLTTEMLFNLIIDEKYKYDVRFIAGVINSYIPSWFIERVLFNNSTETSRKMDFQYSQYIIIPRIDFTNKSDVEMHDRMVTLVNTMLDLNKRLRECGVPSDIEMINRQIDSTDNQIDQLVYRLYGLTDEEIRIVEDSFRKER